MTKSCRLCSFLVAVGARTRAGEKPSTTENVGFVNPVQPGDPEHGGGREAPKDKRARRKREAGKPRHDTEGADGSRFERRTKPTLFARERKEASFGSGTLD